MGFAGRRLLEMGVILSGRIVGATLIAFARFLRSSVAGKGGRGQCQRFVARLGTRAWYRRRRALLRHGPIVAPGRSRGPPPSQTLIRKQAGLDPVNRGWLPTRRGPERARRCLPAFAAGTLAACIVLFTLEAVADPRKSKDPGYRLSVYQEVADEVLALGLIPWDGSKRGCQHNYYGDKPCLRSFSLWRKFADRHGLDRDHTSALIFQAYVRRDYRLGDRLYARVKGYELPPHGGYEGPGLEIMALGLQPDSGKESACQNDPFSSNACRGVVRLWKAFAKKHGLPENRGSAAIFQAYVNGDFVTADRLYAGMTGRRVFYERVYSNIGREAREAGWEAGRRIGEAGCQPNYFADNPCKSTVRAWKKFAKKNNLKLDRKSAAMFQAYAEGDYERGDELYAVEKNVSVEELVERHPAKLRKKERVLPRLVIDIWRSGS